MNSKLPSKSLIALFLPFLIGAGAVSLANEPVQVPNADVEAVFQSENKVENKAETQKEIKDDVKEKTVEAVIENKEETGEIAQEEDSKEGKLEKRKPKKEKKQKDDYSEYLIPEEGYLPVGDVSEKHIQIQGSVSKTEELSLADCLEIALQNNPKIKAAYAQSAVIKENKVQTASNYSPTLKTNTGISRVKPDLSGMPNGIHIKPYTKYLLGTISLSQLVYDFGFTQNQYTINKIEWEVSKQNIESVVNSVVRDVKDSYYNLLFALSAKQVREETVEQYQQMYNQALAFYEIGTKPKVDVTIAASNLADAKANYIEATNAVDLAVSKLNNIMGTPFIEPYVVDTKMPYQETNITMREAVEIANKARPDLKIAVEQMHMADEYVKLAKKAYLPKLSLAADLSMGGRKDFTDANWYTFGGYFQFPVINPVSIVSEVKQARAQLEQQKFDTKSNVNDIYYEIQTSYVLLNDAKQRIAASKATLQTARESYELSKGRYKAGVCDAIELKEAQVTYENAKLAYISNVYTYNSAKASLEKAIGQTLKTTEPEENIEI